MPHGNDTSKNFAIITNAMKEHDTMRLYMRMRALALFSSIIKNDDTANTANCHHNCCSQKPQPRHTSKA